MQGNINNVAIKGIVSAVPKKVEYNEEYFKLLGEKRVKKQTKMTGVKRRHINEMNQTCADLCFVSAQRLIEELEWNKEDIKEN